MMNSIKFAKRQDKLFRSGKSRVDAYREEWDALELRIRNTYEMLSDELGKYFTNSYFLIFSSNDARMYSEFPFVQFSIYRMRRDTESLLPNDTALLFIQGSYGEVTVAFHNYDLHAKNRKIYRVYDHPGKISEKELEKILSRYFEHLAERSRLNKPSYWNWLRSVRSHYLISCKIFVYNKSPLFALKSMTE